MYTNWLVQSNEIRTIFGEHFKTGFLELRGAVDFDDVAGGRDRAGKARGNRRDLDGLNE